MAIKSVQTEYGKVNYIHSTKTTTEEVTDYQKFLAEKIEELHDKIKNGDTEASFQIGAQSFTEKEWDELLCNFDSVQEEIKELMKEKQEKAEEERLDKAEEKKEEMEEAVTEEEILMLISDR